MEFCNITELKGTCETFSEAFLQSTNVPASLEDDIRRLMQVGQKDEDVSISLC